MKLPNVALPGLLLAMGTLLTSCFFAGEDPEPVSQVSSVASLPKIVSGSLPGTLGDTARDTVTIVFRADSGTTLTFEWLTNISPVQLVLDASNGGDVFYTRYINMSSTPVWNDFTKNYDSWVTYGDSNSITLPVIRSGEYRLRIQGAAGSPYRVAVSLRAGLDPWIASPDRWEPDATMGRATLLDSNWQVHTLEAAAQGDVDWFRFPVEAGWSYLVEKTDSTGNSYFPGDLYKQDGTRWGGSMAAVDEAGVLYYRVNGFDGPGGIYKLRLLAWKTSAESKGLRDTCESGDAEARCVLDETASIEGAFNFKYDVDVFRIPVDSGRTYAIHLDRNTHGLRLGLFIDSLGLKPSEVINDEEGRATAVEFFAGRADTVRLLLSADSLAGYGLSLTSSAGIPDSVVMDRYEPDNRPAHASALSMDSAVQIRTLHAGMMRPDTDYIALECDSGKTYSIMLGYLEGRNPEVHVLDGAGVVQGISGSVWTKSRLVTFPCVRSGIYSLRVSGIGSYWAKYALAGVEADGLPDWALPEPGEPDHGAESAVLLQDGESIQRKVDPNDTDWIRLPVKKGLRYHVKLQNTGTVNGPVVSMKVESGVQFPTYWVWAYRTALPGRDSIDVHEDGEQIFQVHLSGAYSGEVIPYTLTVTSTPLPVDSLEPDSSQATAVGLEQGVAYKRRWASIQDTDWVYCDVEKGKQFSLYTLNEGAEPTATFFFEGMEPVPNVSSQSLDGKTRQYDWMPSRTGKVWIRLTSPFAATMAYSLRTE